MGTVWRARDLALEREVALKEVRPVDPALTPEGSEASRMLRARVLREARALARLSDPHVVTIHHIVDEGPYPWLVMELLPGDTLQDRLTAAGPLPPHDAARIGGEVLAALRTAHAAGIQHRDVKPANVMLRADGSAVLTDFGIAALHGSTTLTATGEFLGSPEFIAPERIRGVDEDPASDLWSLGMTLYVCTEGHSPLRRPTSLATLAAVLDEPIPAPVRSGGLAPVLEALLVRDVAARPDEERLARMLAAVEEGRSAAPYPPPPTAPVAAGPVAGPGAAAQGAFGPPPGTTLPSDGAGGVREGRRGRGAMIAAAAVAAAAVIAGVTYGLARSSGQDEGKGGGTVRPATPASSASPGESGGSARAKDSGAPGEPGPGPASPTASVSPPPTSAPQVPDATTGEAGRPDKPEKAGPGDSWVAQLASVPKSDGTSARARQQAELARKVDGVRWLDSDDYASLRSGYWFFYRAGPDPTKAGGFASGHAAADWCKAQGLTSSGQCLGRYLSDERADRGYLCAPDKSEGTGRCTRP
ncbi:hypothetical protein GCM10027091_77990 [Streptomyces daliensis]